MADERDTVVAGPRILVVEDKPELRALVRLAVEPIASATFEAANVRKAWQLIEAQRPGIVLLDVNLESPLDGLELCRRIKSAGPGGPRVVLMSTGAQDADVERGFAAGADSYIVKPFSPAELLRVVCALHAQAHSL